MAIHLKVDLSSKTTDTFMISDSAKKKFLGGRGLGAYLYSKNPLKAENPKNAVFIVPGMLTGSTLPSSSRLEVVTSSPLTGYYTASSAGGDFGAILKISEIDALEITGKCKNWSYIEIKNGEVKFFDAKNLIGKTVFETQEILRKKYKDKWVSIATIGPAGENLVKFSTLMFDERAAGRTGTGWHFGHKKLKAIVLVKEKSGIAAKYPEKMRELTTQLLKEKLINDQQTKTYCTPSFTEWSNEIETYPASNYRRNFVSEDEISGLSLEEYQKYTSGQKACWSCPLACTRTVVNKKGDKVRGPEYETVWSLGANCDNFDIRTLIEANHLCDDYGMDTISTGAVLAWYKECINKGLADDKWSQNRFLELITEIAHKKGVGKQLAEGSVIASERLGYGKEFIAHAKSLELPAWDPRSAIGMAINYATSPTGGDHCKGWTVSDDISNPKTRFSTKGKAKNVIRKQNGSALIDSLGTCIFADFMYNKDIWSQIIKAVTGFNISVKKLEEAGGKIFDLEWKINEKLGHSLNENHLTERIIGYEIEVNGKKEVLTQSMFDEMMKDYVKLRGW